jgi:ATP-dependent Clp protease protease subunit
MAKDSVLSTTIPLPSNRRFLFSKEVTAESISELSERILEVNEEDEFLTKLYHIHELTYIRKPLKIFLDSPGGFVYCCFGLLSIMDKSKTPIHTIATGAAMSCGFLILIHGHRRFAYEHATPMYHQVMGGAIGKISDMEEDVI